jgi:chromosome segregation ATPase
MRAEALLKRATQSRHSLKVARVEALLEAENPFVTVLEEIKKMLALIEEEGEMDKDKKQWCDKTRKQKNKALDKAREEITALEFRISELERNIATLKMDIKSTEDSLTANTESQTSETAERTKVNLAYQKNIENLVNAEDLLKKAVVVLKEYYEETLAAGAAGTGFLQKSKEDPAPPGTWTEFKGESAGGTDAVSMLEFILKETAAEETAAHADEHEDQQAYEASMTSLKAEEATLQETLATKQMQLATAEEEHLGKTKDLKAMKELEADIVAYLLQIKPGCDFITDNIALREQSRAEEAGALRQAKNFLVETPAYKTAVAAAHNETLGDCKDICAVDEEHVACRGCVAVVSGPGYGAGPPTAPGC